MSGLLSQNAFGRQASVARFVDACSSLVGCRNSKQFTNLLGILGIEVANFVRTASQIRIQRVRLKLETEYLAPVSLECDGMDQVRR